uniref:Glycoprotein B n=1 Tax=Cynomolgus macaque cytomegalovirus strain Ottawa TaxID=944969 RepID=E7DB34_9BETA|nr:glycoprotein B [Cynomolgus macaque cytomegalovirus strain Ottawa]
MSKNWFPLLCVSTWLTFCIANATTRSSATATSGADNGTTAPLIHNTTVRTNEVFDADTSKFPYRVCSMAQGTDFLRFEQNIECESFKPTKEDFDEGIMVVYKRNIRAHTFKVHVYQKVLTFRRSYSYINSDYMLGYSVEHLPIPMWEVGYITRLNKCYNSVTRVMSGKTYVNYHKDSYVNETMSLIEDYSNTYTSRFVTVKELWHKPGSTWLYTTSCNVNCMVTVTTARSKYPYDGFVTSSGDVVDISPFYNGSNGKHFGENKDKFHVKKNYTMLAYYGHGENVELVSHPLRAFFERTDSLMSWDIEDEQNSTCQYIFWEQSERTIRSEAEDTFHFTSNSMTATFLSKKTLVNESDPALKCIKEEAEGKLQAIFNDTYNSSYVQSGNVSIYETSGGLLVFWLPVSERSIWEMKQLADGITNATETSRHKRSTDSDLLNNTEVLHSIVYAQLQFTYDTLRNYINRALRQIAEAWCKDQKRTQEVLKELSKVNPTAMLSAIYDKPIAARYTGDVISLAKCVEVDQSTVQVMRDMHVKDGSGLCYSRPVVLFRFYNSSHVQYGQLGEHNEILLGRHRTEACETPSLKIFIAGNTSYEYVGYIFKRQIPLENIPIVNTMISLDIDPLENTDFKALELYTENEIRASNVFNLEEIMQEFNTYKQRVVSVEGKVFDNVPTYLRGLDDFMSGLGSAGKALGVAIGAVGGAMASFVEGVVSFIKNPFGSFTVILFLLAVLGVIYLIYMRQKRAYEKPFEHFFPYVVPPTTVKEAPPSYEQSQYENIKEKAASATKEFSLEEAYQMLLALQKLDQEKRRKAEADDEDFASNGQSAGFLDRLRYRRRGGYQKIQNEYEV